MGLEKDKMEIYIYIEIHILVKRLFFEPAFVAKIIQEQVFLNASSTLKAGWN